MSIEGRRQLAFAGILGLLLLLTGLAGLLPAQEPSSEARTRAAQRAGDRIEVLLREAEDLAVEQSKLLAELRKLEADRQAGSAEVARIERELKETQAALAEARTKAAALSRTADDERPAVESTLVRIYKMGRAGYWPMLLMIEDARAVGRAYRTAAALNGIDRDRLMSHQQTLAALAAERKNLEARAAQLTGLQAEARTARAALDRAVAAHSSLIDSIDGRRDLNAQMRSELQAAQERLQASLSGAEGVSTVSLVLPLGAFRGALPWPARGRVLSPFGRQTSSRFGTAVVRNGVELGVPEGQTVRAVHEGTVAYADQFTGYGTLVIVEHERGAFTLYGHLASVRIARGDRVEAGTPIGTSGLSPGGNPALYFELRVDGRPVDPLQWLQKGPR